MENKTKVLTQKGTSGIETSEMRLLWKVKGCSRSERIRNDEIMADQSFITRRNKTMIVLKYINSPVII